MVPPNANNHPVQVAIINPDAAIDNSNGPCHASASVNVVESNMWKSPNQLPDDHDTAELQAVLQKVAHRYL